MSRIVFAFFFAFLLTACNGGEGIVVCEPYLGVVTGCDKPSTDNTETDTDSDSFVETDDVTDTDDSDVPVDSDSDIPVETDIPVDTDDSDQPDTDTPHDTDDSDVPDTDDSDPVDTDSDTDTGDTAALIDPARQLDCWNNVPFDIKDMRINRAVAITVQADWRGRAMPWIDGDFLFQLNGMGGVVQTVYDLGGGGCGGAVRYQVEFPVGFTMRHPSHSLYNNGIVSLLQSDGTIVEMNYLEACPGGGFKGWYHPRGQSPSYACQAGYSTAAWLGPHGMTHATATQAIRVGELTTNTPVGRPLPIEVDHSHLTCPPGVVDPYLCFVGPIAASGDSYALNLLNPGHYTGTIQGLSPGGILVLPVGFNCASLQTRPGERLCEVARDQFFFIVDDSYGPDEVAFPMWDEVHAEVLASEGIELHNATGVYAADVRTIMENILVVTNPEVAVQ